MTSNCSLDHMIEDAFQMHHLVSMKRCHIGSIHFWETPQGQADHAVLPVWTTPKSCGAQSGKTMNNITQGHEYANVSNIHQHRSGLNRRDMFASIKSSSRVNESHYFTKTRTVFFYIGLYIGRPIWKLFSVAYSEIINSLIKKNKAYIYHNTIFLSIVR